MHRRLAILATLLCGTVAATAQVREQITVEAVDVPVYVFSKGKPIRNLSKDDFELFVNGKKQPIDYFKTVDLTEPLPATAEASPKSAPAAAPASQPALRDRRLFLLMFDLTFTNRPAAIERSRRAAVDMVDHALPGDFFAVATVTPAGIKFTIPFLRDHDAIRRAILRLAPTSARDQLGISITGAEREMAHDWVAMAGGGREDPVPDILASAKEDELEREMLLTKEAFGWFGDVADRLRGLEGFKHVILFSAGGFPFDPARQYTDVKGIASAFQAADVSFDTVDLTQMATGAADPTVGAAPSKAPPTLVSENVAAIAQPSVNAGPKPRTNQSESDSLAWISNATGGTWIHWTNLYAPALNELSTSYSAVYRLGFKPSGPHKGRNDIDVKVKNLPPGARVLFRKGFSSTAPAKGAPDALLLADVIQNDTPQSGTPPEISVVGRRIDVIVPVIQLSKQYGAVDGAEVMLYVFDSEGIPVLSSEKKFKIPEHAEKDRVIQEKLDLPPGSYVAKVLLRIGDSLAFVKESFEISDTD